MNSVVLFLGAYLLVCLGFAYRGWKRRGEDLEDFFITKRTVGGFVAFMTFSATLFSSFTLVGMPGFFYTHGIGSWVFIAFADIFMALMIYFFGIRFWLLGKKFGYITPTEFLRDRYESDYVSVIAVLIGIVFLLPYISIQLIGAGIVLKGALGIPAFYGSFLLALILIIYSELGGMRTVAWTDALQGTILLIVGFLVAILFLREFGGISLMMSQAIEKYPELMTVPGPKGLFTYQILISFFIMIIFMPVTQPQLTVRYFIPESKKTLKLMMMATPIFAFLAMLPQLFIGIGAKIAFPELASGDQALTSVLTLIPPVVGAIAVTGVIAASMSTADSQFLVLSSLITKDFYVNILNPKSSNRKRLKIARISMFLLLLLAFIISLKPPKLIVTLSILSFAGTLQVLPTMLGGLFWKRATREGAISSMLVGVLTLSLFQWVLKPPFGIHQGIWGLIFGSLSFVLISLITKPPEKKAKKILGYLKEALGGLENGS
ncbi:MAG: hypothetical protein ACE5K0_09440 [Candidatus Methanofastidiosia archaeon]